MKGDSDSVQYQWYVETNEVYEYSEMETNSMEALLHRWRIADSFRQILPNLVKRCKERVLMKYC